MSIVSATPPPETTQSSVIGEIVALAKCASVELTSRDVKYLDESRALLDPGTRMYVSHLPNQTWIETRYICEAVRACGFEPIPHIPVRLIESADVLDRLLGDLAGVAKPKEIMLISGDYPSSRGPYTRTEQAIGGGSLEKRGYRRLSVAGHPEGHPKVELSELRRSERDKSLLAAERGLAVTILTQFLFEHEPFLKWAANLRAHGVKARLVCGVAGPAKVTTLLRYAVRCGIGPSVRALGIRGGAFLNMLGDHGPDRMIRSLAEARVAGCRDFDGIHVFGFGGYLRTVKWLAEVRGGSIILNPSGGFELQA